MNTTYGFFFKIFTINCLILLVILTGCNQENTAKQMKELRKGYDQLTDRLSEEYKTNEERLSELTDSEIKKLTTIEYKVIDIELSEETDSEMIESKLKELGVKRWDCFHLEHRVDKLQAYCKRLPASHLRVLAKISRLIP